MVVPILRQSSNRQEAKNAKKFVTTPRRHLGDFERNLAPFAGLAVQNDTFKRETIDEVSSEKVCVTVHP
jgi:hypothetical protein